MKIKNSTYRSDRPGLLSAFDAPLTSQGKQTTSLIPAFNPVRYDIIGGTPMILKAPIRIQLLLIIEAVITQ